MLSLCDESIVLPLRLIFSNILSTGAYPDIWKQANVTPVHKKGSKQLVSNYKPISLLPICGKLFERIVFKYTYTHLISNNLITMNQSGFRPGDSTINQLNELVNVIHKSFDQRESLEVRVVFLDISKAFDKVCHEGLLFKLEQNGVSGPVLLLLQNYLANRKQRVVLNGSSSTFYPIEPGVPQGSVLGPLLFLVYINDLEDNIISKIKIFADDTMLFSIVHNPALSAAELNYDLHVISQWAQQWKMSFNPEPTKQAIEILFSHKRTGYNHPPLHFNHPPLYYNHPPLYFNHPPLYFNHPPLYFNHPPLYFNHPPLYFNHPPLYFNGCRILKKKFHRHLGLTLDSKLAFTEHINDRIKIANRFIGVLKYLSKYLPLKTLDQMYKMFIRPHLDYGDVIFHIPHTQSLFDSSISLHPLMERMEQVQYQAALAITGCWHGSNRAKLYEELGWETLSDRRWSRRLIQLYKIRNNMTPLYLSKNIPLQRSGSFRLNGPTMYQEYFCNTTRYMNSFFQTQSDLGIILLSLFVPLVPSPFLRRIFLASFVQILDQSLVFTIPRAYFSSFYLGSV